MSNEQQPLRIFRDESNDAALPDNVQPEELDLSMLLAAWQTATDRLQQTHQALRQEVARLTDELEAKNRELARKNRLADLGQMAAHVAHEVRNSLVPMKLYLSLLKRRVDGDAGTCDVANKIGSGLAALETTVDGLLTFTADREPQRQRVNIDELASGIIESLAPQLAAQKIVCRLELPRLVQVSLDRDMLHRAVLNLVLNAIDAMPDGGELVITCWHGPHVFELEVADSGPGVPEGMAERLFEPFFTTKREGTGLGLAIVQRIAEAHGGNVRVQNCPEGGAAFTLRFPQLAMERAA
jgi:signal transduction histidine kinase